MSYIENGNSNVNFICSDDKANIFLIGDSIRLGYCETVKKSLSDKAEVFYIDENCRNSQYVITSLNGWQGKFDHPEKIDIVQFNCGHWDVAHWSGAQESLTGKEEYDKNIRLIIFLLKKYFVNAKLIFATTTPMNPNGSLGINPRTTKEIDEYNRIAIETVKSEGVLINDLNAFVRDWDSGKYDDYCHFTKEAFQCLGEYVAKLLESYL